MNNQIEAFIINYNGKNTVLSTIESLYKSEGIKVSITVIDDHSTDESPELIKRNFPEITVHILPFNTKRANILRNKALQFAQSEYFLITDNDLYYDNQCLAELVKIMNSDNKIATCSPRLMYWDQPDKIYSAGTKVHFIGAAVSELRDKSYQNKDSEPAMNSGGGICLIRLEAVKKLGGFDENFMQGWGSDGELYQRLMRGGYRCLYVPAAFALHEDKLNIKARKFRAIGQTYNRWMFILSHYSVTLIVLSIPAFIFYEIFQAMFVLLKGIFMQYLQGNILVFKNLGIILKKRKFIQSIKIVSDKEVLCAGNIYIAPSLVEKHFFIKIFAAGFSSFLNFYWLLIKKIIP